MGIEIERKYTVKRLPDALAEYPYHEIEQGYLNVHPAIRVRKEDAVCYMTYKGAGGGMVKEEYNLALDQASYAHLLAKADGHIIRKRRYLIPLNEDAYQEDYLSAHPDVREAIRTGAMKIELDIFSHPVDDLVIAEVEFPDEDAAANYRPAAWFAREVTGERRYSNAALTRL